jgi:hypothetical protein
MEISYAGYKTRMDAEYMNRVTGEDAIFIVDNFNQGTYVYFVGEAGIKHNNFTLRFKKYMGNLGAIAPVGTYMSLDIGTNNWKIKDADYYGMDENKNVYKNKEAPVDVKTVTLGFSIGTRRMLTEHIGLVLRSGLSYPISSSQLITDGYSDNLENLHELVLFNERRANIMRGTLQFQLGVSYNL